MKIEIVNRRTAVAALLGAALFLALPLSAQADQGKWWDPQKGGANQERGSRQLGQQTRGGRSGTAGDRFPDRRYREGRPRFQRDMVILRDGRGGPRYRANRIWLRPTYFHRQRVIALRPVRYFVAAHGRFGGVHLHVRFHDYDGFYYGCNFCDARFDDYGDYRHHVVRCADRPRGYRFEIRDWDDDWMTPVDDVDGYDHG